VADGRVALLLLRDLPRAARMTTFSLIGISIMLSLSYNILLGQTGMLSFGHAVYYGLRRLPRDPRHQHHRRQQAADPAAAGCP
jgi:hypothetical protein